MQADEDVVSWLQGLPLGVPADVAGESVYLHLHDDGAELGAFLIRDYTPMQLEIALKRSFQSILRFDAGLGVSADGRSVVLSCMLPGVSSWVEAADALENLLTQISMMRAAMGPTKPVEKTNKGIDRTEQRLRMLLKGGLK
jgi:hypothetical protein